MHFPPLVERSASSYVDFEPREVMRDAPPPNDAPPATKVGNDGIRVGNAALPEWGRGGKEARTL